MGNGNLRIAAQVEFYDLQILGNVSLDKVLASIYKDAKQYCSQNQLQLHMNALTKDALGMQRASNFPSASLGCKVYNVSFQFLVFLHGFTGGGLL